MDVDTNGEIVSTGEGQIFPMMALLMGRMSDLMKQREEEDKAEADAKKAEQAEAESKGGNNSSGSKDLDHKETVTSKVDDESPKENKKTLKSKSKKNKASKK